MISLIPPQYKLAAIAAVVLVTFGAGVGTGAHFVNKAWDYEKAQEQLASARVEAAAVQRANTVAKELADAKYQAEVDHANAEKTLNALREHNRNIVHGMRRSAQGGSSGVPEGGQVPGVAVEEGRTDVPTDVAATLVDEAFRADQYAEQLNACIGRLKTIEHQLGK